MIGPSIHHRNTLLMYEILGFVTVFVNLFCRHFDVVLLDVMECIG